VPVAAAGLADVGTAHLHPLEVRRRGQHLSQQLAVAGLDPGPLAQPQAGIGHPLGQIVAQLLELTEVEHSRLGRNRADQVIDLDPSESLREEAGQLALEPSHLAPQLDPSEALVDVDAKRSQAVSVEQIRHRPTTSVDHPIPALADQAASVAAAIHSASSTAIWGTPLTWTATIARRRLVGSTS
jgi:hypothetical protein